MESPPRTSEPFAILAEVVTGLQGELDLSRLLPDIVAAARSLTGARYAALGVLAPNSDLIASFIHDGMDDDTVAAIGSTPTGGGLLGELIRHGSTIVTNRLADHPASEGFPPNHPPMDTFLGVPLRLGNEVFGNLYLTEKPGGFTQQDVDMTTVLAAQAGVAIKAAQMSDQLQLGAIQDERDRISRDLHDGVIQSLFSIGMRLESAWPMTHTDPEQVQERINVSIDQLDLTIRQIRSVIFTLRGNTDGGVSLGSGLIALAEEFRSADHPPPSLDIGSGLDALVPDDVVPDVLHIVREALSNAVRHADADRVAIVARVVDDLLEVQVKDSGRGFRKDSVVLGHGLGNMAERAAILGADLTLDSRPTLGTSVALRVPLNERSGVQ